MPAIFEVQLNSWDQTKLKFGNEDVEYFTETQLSSKSLERLLELLNEVKDGFDTEVVVALVRLPITKSIDRVGGREVTHYLTIQAFVGCTFEQLKTIKFPITQSFEGN